MTYKHKNAISGSDYRNRFNNNVLGDDQGNNTKEAFKEAYKIALETRKFEINLYWKRTAYFVIFIGAVFVALYTIALKSPLYIQMALCSIGYLLSVLWYAANRGSKFWQENWESHIRSLEKELNFPVFGIIKRPKNRFSCLLKSYPFSVSRINQMISLIISIGWLALLVSYCTRIGYEICCHILAGLIIFLVAIGVTLCLLHFCLGFAAKERVVNDEASEYFDNYSD